MHPTPLPALYAASKVVGERYEIIEHVGTGGMAVVYRAKDLSTGEVVALKVLSRTHLSKPRALARFRSEAQAMQECQHRYVLPVHAFKIGSGEAWIAMEYAEAGSLADWVRRHGPMPPRMAVNVMMQVCKGVAAAHAYGIVHRDVKPQNVLISGRGRCRVSDFGVARTDAEGLTKTGVALGSAGYMAPEQRADAKHVEPRADIYSLGATLFNLLTGRIASDLFFADQAPEILDEVHEALRPIVLQATRYRAQDRYADPIAMGRELFLVRDDLPPDPLDTPRLTSGLSGHSLGMGLPLEDSPTHETGPSLDLPTARPSQPRRSSAPTPPPMLRNTLSLAQAPTVSEAPAAIPKSRRAVWVAGSLAIVCVAASAMLWALYA